MAEGGCGPAAWMLEVKVGTGRWATTFRRCSNSKTTEVAGVDVEGVGGIDGAGWAWEAGGWSPQYLGYALNVNHTMIAMTKMATAVMVEDGRCRLLSTLVEFSILSAISLVGLSGRGVNLHMLGRGVTCQWLVLVFSWRGGRGGGGGLNNFSRSWKLNLTCLGEREFDFLMQECCWNCEVTSTRI